MHHGYDAGCGLDGGRNPPASGLPSGRMSLLEMINWSLSGFVAALQTLSMEMANAARKAHADPDARLSPEDRERITANLNYISEQIRKLSLEGPEERLGRIFTGLRIGGDPSYATLANELNILGQAIEDGIRYERFFRYEREKARPLMRMPGEWAASLAKFASAQSEIEAGLDCYGLERYPACVFHMMRVAEIGMRALARERQVTFPNHRLEWAEWENVIDQIDSKAKAATAGMSRGPERDAARAFYAAAIAQLRAFKETRNRIMHTRGPVFDDLDALRAINQVRDFMNGLSAKIGEKTKTPIRRWP